MEMWQSREVALFVPQADAGMLVSRFNIGEHSGWYSEQWCDIVRAMFDSSKRMKLDRVEQCNALRVTSVEM